MKIGIITLPLHTNYGGILQAYALKTFLESVGHEAIVLDPIDKMPAPGGLRAPFVYASRMLKRGLKGKKGPEVFREHRFRRELPVVGKNTSAFVEKYISPRMIKSYGDISEGEFDAFVVGSDQVWRPRFFGKIEDAFLAFTSGWDVKRLAYAASFGTDQLEYEYQQLEQCSALLSKFDGVSVRELGAVEMCSEWFDYENAVHVLDPVMMLDADCYKEFAATSGDHSAKGKILTYLLDRSAHKMNVVEFIRRVSSKEVHDVSVSAYDKSLPVSDRVVPPLETWLAGFSEADMVVTDSFHGCVLSILMHKPFIVVENSYRGMSRIKSLLDMFALDQRLVQGIDPEDDGTFFLSDPDWEGVETVLNAKRAESAAFLLENLK